VTEDMEEFLNDLHYRIILLEQQVIELQKAAKPAEPAKPAEEPVDAFDEFWASYPRKVGKALARKAFAKVDGPSALVGLDEWLAAGAFNDDPKYILHASTWLNQKCYNDEPTPYVSKFTKPQISKDGGVSSTRKALDEWLNDGT